MSGKVVRLRLAKIARNATSRRRRGCALAFLSSVGYRPAQWFAVPACSGDVVVNPGLKSDRDRSRSLPALQGEVAGADQMAHRAVADPNPQAPQPHAPPPPVGLEALGSRRLETRYIRWVDL